MKRFQGKKVIRYEVPSQSEVWIVCLHCICTITSNLASCTYLFSQKSYSVLLLTFPGYALHISFCCHGEILPLETYLWHDLPCIGLPRTQQSQQDLIKSVKVKLRVKQILIVLQKIIKSSGSEGIPAIVLI